MMARSRARARQAGTEMEVWSREHLRRGLARRPFGRYIDRRPKNGAKDLGDLANIETLDGKPIVVEVKNTTKLQIAGFLKEAEVERQNADAAAAVVIAKRIGIGETRMGEQLVLMTLDDLIVLLGGERLSQGGTDAVDS